MTEKMILRDDPEAATRVTVEGWRSRRGFFYGDNESVARYDGCTHVPCSSCGNPVEKLWTACRPCRDLKEEAKYDAMPKEAWDGVAMVYSQALGRYFESPEEALEAREPGDTLADLRLILCTPNTGRHLTEDYFCDELPEDGDLPEILLRAIEAFNIELSKAPPLSWSPGPFALLTD